MKKFGFPGIFSTIFVLYVCSPDVLGSNCIPPQNGRAMFHHHHHRAHHLFSINTCNPCRHHGAPTSPLEICQLKHLLERIRLTSDLLNETEHLFQQSYWSDNNICREHNDYVVPDNDDVTYALVESYELLTSVTLNITVIGEYPGSVLDTTRLKRLLHHVLCEMKYLLQNEPLANTVYTAELQLPGLTRDNRIVFTCRNLRQAKKALDFMYTYIGRALGLV